MRSNIVILLFIIVTSSSYTAHAQYQGYLRGSDVTRSIAKKLGFNINGSLGISCQGYVGTVDQTNTLLGAPSVETGKVTSETPDTAYLQQMSENIDSCVGNLSDKKATALIQKIFSEKTIQTLCPASGTITLCPPGLLDAEARIEVVTQVLTKPGLYNTLENINFSKRINLQKALIKDFMEYFLGPDELLLESYSESEISFLKEGIRVALVKKVSNPSLGGQGQSSTLLGFMVKTILLRDEFLKINY